MEDLDREADAFGDTLGARVTLIAPGGRVVGDTAEDGASLAAMENHGTRPEVELARANGRGVTRRFSTTVERDLLYVALAVDQPGLGVVRLALPLTEVDDQIGSVQRATAVGLLAALAGGVVLAWIVSNRLSRRVNDIAEVARRYVEGDLTVQVGHSGDDEFGTVARALDSAVRELGRRLGELSRNRRLTDAILSSMAEGVLVVDARGHAQMANDAVRRTAADVRIAGRAALRRAHPPSRRGEADRTRPRRGRLVAARDHAQHGAGQGVPRQCDARSWRRTSRGWRSCSAT